jgi:hypothetical protein
MVMTYNSLVTDITNWINTTNTTTLAEIPNFIYLTEQEICRKFRTIGYLIYVHGAFIPNAQAGGMVLAKPLRWRANVSFTCANAVNGNVCNILQLRTYEYLRDYFPDVTATPGLPLFYSDYAYNNWLVAPMPDLAYPYEIGYIEMPVPLTINQQTNWLTNNAPDALLWGSLCKAIPFLKDDERIPMWQASYKDALESLNMIDKTNFYDRVSKRDSD